MFREIVAAGAAPQLSLARRDRELQVEEGQPPIEVASVEQEALRWRKNEDLEKWKKRRYLRNARGEAASDETHVTKDETREDDEGSVAQPEQMHGNTESPEEEESGTLFDGRS
jgi:hypothetical protein